MGIPWICDFLSTWMEFNLGGFDNSFAIRLCLDIINLTTVTFLIVLQFVIMALFSGRVDIHSLGGAATCDEGDTGEQLGAEDQAELHQEHIHHH